MSFKKLLLTGASGFLGRFLIPEFLGAGFTVEAVSRKRIESTDAVRWVQGDITNEDFLATAIDGCDVVVHAAGKTGEPLHADDRREFFQVNGTAAAAVAKAARRAGVRQFIHLSSTGVFGPGTGSFTEDSSCRPANVYEESKLAGEQAVLAEASALMDVLVVRPSNVFWEKHPWNKLLSWLRSVKQGRAVLVQPPDINHVNYVYAGDVARAIAVFATAFLDNHEAHAGIYIINTPATVQDFYEASASALGVPYKPIKVPKGPLMLTAMICDAVSHATGLCFPLTRDKVRELCNRQVFTSSKLKALQPQFPYFGLQDGLRKLCTYYKESDLL